MDNISAPNNRKRNIWLFVVGALFLILGIVWFLYWLFIGQFYVSTEDAYVHGNQVNLNPQVEAGVRAIWAEETDLVTRGQLVVELDSTDYLIQFEERKKKLGDTVREISSIFQQVEAKKAKVSLQEAEKEQAELDWRHRIPLAQIGAVSQEEYEIYQTKLKIAEANLLFAQEDLKATEALVMGTTVTTHPKVEEAVLGVKMAYLNLIRCRILSPVTGYIAKRKVNVGDHVRVGDYLLVIVPLEEIWVEANYKETQLGKVRIGQPVSFTADIYGRGVKYHGKVVGFQSGSGNAFALLPAENASGNWIKIIQRVPIRIEPVIQEIIQHPLLLGLSLGVTTDVHDVSGKMLAARATMQPLYTTPIYQENYEEMETITSVIQEIIHQNL